MFCVVVLFCSASFSHTWANLADQTVNEQLHELIINEHGFVMPDRLLDADDAALVREGKITLDDPLTKTQ